MITQIRLGTVAPIGFDDFPPGQWLQRLRRLGCTVVQAYRRQDAGVTVGQMKDYLAAGSLPCDSIHGLFGPQYDPSSTNEAVRQFAVETYRGEGRLVLELGGSLVVVHCSPRRDPPASPGEHRMQLDCLRRSVVELGQYGERIGVTYAFENLPPYHGVGRDAAELARLLADLAAPHTAMCFDTGHALLSGDAPAAIRAAGRQIAYAHFSDNSGLADEHEMPTRGKLDCDAVADALAAVRYSGTLMLEVFRPIAVLDEMIAAGYAARLAQIVARASGGK
jgi:sugar phosphate isomerase/epimerase